MQIANTYLMIQSRTSGFEFYYPETFVTPKEWTLQNDVRHISQDHFEF
jgi:hypothetical protein